MTNTPILGLPYPAASNSPNVPQDLQNLATGMDSFGIARFSTTGARDSAITSPVDGEMAYVSGTGELYVRLGGSWVSAKPRIIRMTSDFTVTDSVTLTNATNFNISVESNSTYIIHGTIVYFSSGTTGNDMNTGWTVPSGAGGSWFAAAPGSGVSIGSSNSLFTQANTWGTAIVMGTLTATAQYAPIYGMLNTAGSSGTLQLQVAEGAAVAGVTSVTVRADSFATVWKVA